MAVFFCCCGSPFLVFKTSARFCNFIFNYKGVQMKEDTHEVKDGYL